MVLNNMVLVRIISLILLLEWDYSWMAMASLLRSVSVAEIQMSRQPPLEKKILKDFELSKFIVCTDAGLSSKENRKFNDRDGRAFITTQSVKKLKKYLKQWASAPTGWHLHDGNDSYDISLLDKDEELYKKHKSDTFYKERWIKEDGLEQKLIVPFLQ